MNYPKIQEQKTFTDRDLQAFKEENFKWQKDITALRTKLAVEASRNGMLQFKMMQLESRMTENQKRTQIQSSVAEKDNDEFAKLQQELDQKSMEIFKLGEENARLKDEVSHQNEVAIKMEQLRSKLTEYNLQLDKLRNEEREARAFAQLKEQKILELEEKLALANHQQIRMKEMEERIALANQHQAKIKELEEKLQSVAIQQFQSIPPPINELLPPPSLPDLPPPPLDNLELPPPPPPVIMITGATTIKLNQVVQNDGTSKRDEGRQIPQKEVSPSIRDELMSSIKAHPTLKHVEVEKEPHQYTSFEDNSVLNLIAKALIDRRAAIGGDKTEEDDSLSDWL